MKYKYSPDTEWSDWERKALLGDPRKEFLFLTFSLLGSCSLSLLSSLFLGVEEGDPATDLLDPELTGVPRLFLSETTAIDLKKQ